MLQQTKACHTLMHNRTLKCLSSDCEFKYTTARTVQIHYCTYSRDTLLHVQYRYITARTIQIHYCTYGTDTLLHVRYRCITARTVQMHYCTYGTDTSLHVRYKVTLLHVQFKYTTARTVQIHYCTYSTKLHLKYSLFVWRRCTENRTKKFGVLKGMAVQSTVLWDTPLCSLVEIYWRIGKTSIYLCQITRCHFAAGRVHHAQGISSATGLNVFRTVIVQIVIFWVLTYCSLLG